MNHAVVRLARGTPIASHVTSSDINPAMKKSATPAHDQMAVFDDKS